MTHLSTSFRSTGVQTHSTHGKKRRPTPLSVRLSDAERAELTARAGSVPLSTYVKSVLFDQGANVRQSPVPATVDRAIVAKLLAFLGASHVAQNLSSLAMDAKDGNLIMDEEDKALLASAGADIRIIRNLLMEAMGKQKSEVRSG